MTTKEKPLIIAVTGPTAVGKTNLAMRLSKLFPIEVINMDSAQIYSDMNIGTAKITAEEQIECPHHLLDIISPEESYSVAQFVADVHNLIPQINARKAIPLVVGGSILYYKALTEGLAELPTANYDLRKELYSIIDNNGYDYLWQELHGVDPASAAKLQGKDRRRLVRFIEIYRLTGKAPSILFTAQKNKESPYQFFHISFSPKNRIWLHKRIEKRFIKMLEMGFVNEVIGLRKKYKLHRELPSMRCAGYRQIWDYLQGKFDNLPKNKNNKNSNSPYQEMCDRGIFATRQMAKRQLTWLRKFSADITIDEQIDKKYRNIVKNINKLILVK